ncbi:hypothetical protein BBP40_011235 [Aspergillus hancockii]|nr:hypothetical protein BBP40_011235 [Aspergillus hancockii]
MNPDIYAYLHKSLYKDPDFQKWNSSVLSKIETELMERVNGMFRWAACQRDILKDCLTEQQIDHCLRSLPKTLDEMYDRILDNIEDVHKKHSIRILQILIYPVQPSTIEEVVDAIAIEPVHKPHFDEKYRMSYP